MTARPPKDIVPGLYAAYASVVLFVIVTAVFVGARTTAWTGVGGGLVGGALIGFFSIGRGLATPLRGAAQFARPWLWFTAWAAVGLYDGRTWPLAASGALTAAMSLVYLLGGLAGAWYRRRHA